MVAFMAVSITIIRGSEMAYLLLDPSFILVLAIIMINGKLLFHLSNNVIAIIYILMVLYVNEVSLSRFPNSFKMEDSLRGKTYIVTGANSGTGYAVVQALLSENATVIMACRNINKCLEAASTLSSPFGIQTAELDLSSLNSVKEFASEFKTRKIDGVVNNAGFATGSSVPPTKELLEPALGAMHLGHYLLTKLLVEERNNQTFRIVNVASAMHLLCFWFNCIDRLEDRFKEPSDILAYERAKFANILHAFELSKQYKNVTAYSINLGLVATNITRLSKVLGNIQRDAVLGAYPIVYALKVNAPREYNGFVVDTTFGLASPEQYNRILSGAFMPVAWILSLMGSDIPRLSKQYTVADLNRDAETLWKVSEKLIP